MLPFPGHGGLPFSGLTISFHLDHCRLSCGVELTKLHSPATHISCECAQILSEAQGPCRVYAILCGWAPINFAARAHISFRIRISHVSHSEFLAVANHIMFPLTYGLSFYSHHCPCCLCPPGITFSQVILLVTFQNSTQGLLPLGHCCPSGAVITSFPSCLRICYPILPEMELVSFPLVILYEAEVTETSQPRLAQAWQLSHSTSEKAR